MKVLNLERTQMHVNNRELLLDRSLEFSNSPYLIFHNINLILRSLILASYQIYSLIYSEVKRNYWK